jgi:galactokinase
MSDAATVADAFAARFGARPRLFRAPGRINIIGEHTDYSGGFALPAAIDLDCIVAIARNGGHRHRVYSANLDETADLAVDSFVRTGKWSDYVAGVAAALRRAGITAPACDLLIDSAVPAGAGVSSSAALEVAATMALLAMAEEAADGAAVARWAREAETDFVGTPCGPMDQIASVHGRAGHALLLDCRDLSVRPVALPSNAAFVLIDSGVKHALVDGGYASRRRDCEEAAALLGKASLRDAADNDLVRLPAPIRSRARHVLSENARTLAAARALETGDLADVGGLMNRSHESLRDHFEVTIAETDLLAGVARGTPGIYGARQMGGGFGGSIIALADAPHADEAGDRIAARYRAETGHVTSARVCAAVDGAREVRV